MILYVLRVCVADESEEADRTPSLPTTVRVNRPHEHISADSLSFDAFVRRSVTASTSICQALMLVVGELVASLRARTSCDAGISSFCSWLGPGISNERT
jgi:hypothetical protein